MKRRIRRKEKKQKKIIITLSIVLILFLSAGYAAFQSNITLKAKGNTVLKKITIGGVKIPVVTSGDGLYADDTTTGRYVYRGTNPKNYIKLGSDRYRIMAVESDGTLKVIKNGSIGYITFDPGYSTSISGMTDENSIIGTRYSNISTDYCYQSSGTESNYYGCNVWGSRTTMLDSLENNITQMPREIGGTLYDLPEKEAYLNTYLNSTWLSTLSTDIQNKIVSHLFNVGTVNPSSSLNETINQESNYKWKGKVGLMTLSDYIKSNSNIEQCSSYSLYNVNYVTCKGTQWLSFTTSIPPKYESSYPWILSSYSNSKAYSVFFIHSVSLLCNGETDISRGVSPVFYLSSNITLSDGTGAGWDPYVVN